MADATLVQGAGMAVRRHRGSVKSMGLQAIQQALNEGMIDIAKGTRKRGEVFDKATAILRAQGEALSPDQYELVLKDLKKQRRKYIWGNGQDRAMILQDLNKDVTQLTKVKTFEERLKNLPDDVNKGGLTNEFKSKSRIGADLVDIIEGNGEIVKQGNEYGYYLHDEELQRNSNIAFEEAKAEYIKTGVLDLPTADELGKMSISEVQEKYGLDDPEVTTREQRARRQEALDKMKVAFMASDMESDMPELKDVVKDENLVRRFYSVEDMDKMIDNNIVDANFMSAMITEANSEYDTGLKLLPGAAGQDHNYDRALNKTYAMMINANNNSLINHSLGPELSFKDGMTQALQTVTYSEAGIMVDHDNNPDTEDISLKDAYGIDDDKLSDIMNDDKVAGKLDDDDTTISESDARAIVDHLINEDANKEMLFGRGGYVNRYFANFLGQNFENGKAQSQQTGGPAAVDEKLKAEIQAKLKGKTKPIVFSMDATADDDGDGIVNGDDPNHPAYRGRGAGGTSSINPSEAKAKHKTLKPEELSDYTPREKWDLYTSILADTGIPLDQKQAYMKANGLKTRKESRQSGYFS